MPSPIAEQLPRLPIPPLKDTLTRYLARVRPLQDDKRHARTTNVVFGKENVELLSKLHEQLVAYDTELASDRPVSSYIEQFWYDSYLQYNESVVLNVNPYFQLQDDPTMRNVASAAPPFGEHTVQIKRTAKLACALYSKVYSRDPPRHAHARQHSRQAAVHGPVRQAVWLRAYSARPC